MITDYFSMTFEFKINSDTISCVLSLEFNI